MEVQTGSASWERGWWMRTCVWKVCFDCGLWRRSYHQLRCWEGCVRWGPVSAMFVKVCCFWKMDYIKMQQRRDVNRRSLHLASRFCFFPFQGLWSALQKTDLTLRSALFILYLPNPIPPYKNYKEHCVLGGNLLFNYANMTIV